MPDSYSDVALLTEQRYAVSYAPEGNWYIGNILRDDQILQHALEEKGLSSTRIDWADPHADWSRFGCLVFRTTWDYYERISEFRTWLSRVKNQVRLSNEAEIIEWNLDKHYLADLESRGIPIVPVRFLEPGDDIDLAGMIQKTGWEGAVIKPCISGGARHTYRFNKQNASEIQRIIAPLLKHESFIVQPFVQDVIDTGEDTLMILDGTYTHAVRKVAKPGDFRVQDDHGGSYFPITPDAEQIELAEQVMDIIQPVPQYGRVDMVRNNSGRWMIIELELIEPELWLREHPPAATYMADAIARRLS